MNNDVDLKQIILFQLDKIENELNNFAEKLTSIDKTLVRQEEHLKEHMRRTELLEATMEPIKKDVNMVQGVLKFIAFLGVLAGIVKLFVG